MSQRMRRAARILLVEDNPADALLMYEALDELGPPLQVRTARTGDDAWALLQDDPFPDLILLDLNLPGMSGLELLEKIRTDSRLSHLPIIILTSSEAPDDVMAAYRGHASSFLTKPDNPNELGEATEALVNFWLETAKLPNADLL